MLRGTQPALVATTLACSLFAGPAICSLRADEPDSKQAVDVAQQILDEARPEAERKQLVNDHPKLALPLVQAMAPALDAGSKEEYRRIPWMWRVSVAAGRRNNADEIRGFLAWALPEGDKPLSDWQTVVIGGGMVSGLSDTGVWPAERIAEILGTDKALGTRWQRALQLASQKADDEHVPTPTRYDALRLTAMQPWDSCAGQLVRCLGRDVHAEVQLGAIGGLSDIHSPHVPQALLSGAESYSAQNKHAMLNAILRDESRIPALLDAMAAGRVKRSDLDNRQLKKLQGVTDEKLKARVQKTLNSGDKTGAASRNSAATISVATISHGVW